MGNGRQSLLRAASGLTWDIWDNTVHGLRLLPQGWKIKRIDLITELKRDKEVKKVPVFHQIHILFFTDQGIKPSSLIWNTQHWKWNGRQLQYWSQRQQKTQSSAKCPGSWLTHSSACCGSAEIVSMLASSELSHIPTWGATPRLPHARSTSGHCSA